MTKICGWCNEEFTYRSKNQIYCSTDCRLEATKRKIVERSQVAKFRSRQGKERRCAGGCNTLISVYNDVGFCNSCLVNKKKVDKFIRDLKDYFYYEEK